MPEKDYQCNCCRAAFRKPKANTAEDRAVVECPQCGSIEVQKLDDPDKKTSLVSRTSCGGG
jgi:DNA-directed RNA polymerase subunit RPC12/RpoP